MTYRRDHSCRRSFRCFAFLGRNVLRLTYPALMDEIPVSRFGEAHLLEITELRLPREGFFTLRMTALYLVSRHITCGEIERLVEKVEVIAGSRIYIYTIYI